MSAGEVDHPAPPSRAGAGAPGGRAARDLRRGRRCPTSLIMRPPLPTTIAFWVSRSTRMVASMTTSPAAGAPPSCRPAPRWRRGSPGAGAGTAARAPARRPGSARSGRSACPRGTADARRAAGAAARAPDRPRRCRGWRRSGTSAASSARWLQASSAGSSCGFCLDPVDLVHGQHHRLVAPPAPAPAASSRPGARRGRRAGSRDELGAALGLDHQQHDVHLRQRRQRLVDHEAVEGVAGLVHAGRVDEDNLPPRRPSPARLSASAPVQTPTMRLRVVCGVGLTMASFSPTMRLSSVDLPTLGRPTIATVPATGRATPSRRPLSASPGLPRRPRASVRAHSASSSPRFRPRRRRVRARRSSRSDMGNRVLYHLGSPPSAETSVRKMLRMPPIHIAWALKGSARAPRST